MHSRNGLGKMEELVKEIVELEGNSPRDRSASSSENVRGVIHA